jgi:hypothetical protein
MLTRGGRINFVFRDTTRGIWTLYIDSGGTYKPQHKFYPTWPGAYSPNVPCLSLPADDAVFIKSIEPANTNPLNPQEVHFNIQSSPTGYYYLFAVMDPNNRKFMFSLNECDPETGENRSRELYIPAGFDGTGMSTGDPMLRNSRMQLDMQSGLVVLKSQEGWTWILSYV